MIKQFIRDWKQWGFKIAWYNVKFLIAYRMLNAKSMKVTPKKEQGGVLTVVLFILALPTILLILWLLFD